MARFSFLSAAVMALAVSSQVANVAAQDNIDPCISKSIRDTGCSGPTDISCMCKGAAEGSFLNDVLTSMVQYCPKTVSPQGLFGVLSAQCKNAGYQIPPEKIQQAQQLADKVFASSNGGSTNNGGGGGQPQQQEQEAAPATTQPPSANPGSGGQGNNNQQNPTIGTTTAVLPPAGSGNESSLIMAPTGTPKPSHSGGSGGYPTGTAASPSSSTTGAGGENAGIRSSASLGAAVLGLAAAVAMW